MLNIFRKDDNKTRFFEEKQSGAVYCKLFSDTVTVTICDLRKNELNGRGGFSCFGCSIDNFSSAT